MPKEQFVVYSPRWPKPALLIAAFFLFASSYCRGDEKCNDDECIVSTSVAASLCPSQTLSINWNKKSNWRIATCPCNCTQQDNTNWIINSKGTIFSLNIGRVFGKNLFHSQLNPVVPDIISPHEMCEPANRQKIDDSDYLILEKRPSNRKDPYCYNAIYVYALPEQISLSSNSGQIPLNDPDYFTNIDDTTKEKLIELMNLYAPFNDSEMSPTLLNKEKVVASKKANLYLLPSVDKITKAYLIGGDKVTITDVSIDNQFAYIIYVKKSNDKIQRWIKCSDLDGCN